MFTRLHQYELTDTAKASLAKAEKRAPKIIRRSKKALKKALASKYLSQAESRARAAVDLMVSARAILRCRKILAAVDEIEDPERLQTVPLDEPIRRLLALPVSCEMPDGIDLEGKGDAVFRLADAVRDQAVSAAISAAGEAPPDPVSLSPFRYNLDDDHSG